MKPYNVKPVSGWDVEPGQNAVYGGTPDNKTYAVYGRSRTLPRARRPAGRWRCSIFTWQTPRRVVCEPVLVPPRRAVDCDKHHTSGYDRSVIDLSPNIWVADVSGQIEEVPASRSTTRSTRARYPNIPGGVEVSCGYGCMISGRRELDASDFNKYGPVNFYTDNITSTTGPTEGGSSTT